MMLVSCENHETDGSDLVQEREELFLHPCLGLTWEKNLGSQHVKNLFLMLKVEKMVRVVGILDRLDWQLALRLEKVDDYQISEDFVPVQEFSKLD